VIQLPPLYPLQLRIATDEARFRVVCAGRRTGKSTLAVAVAVHAGLAGRRVWWVAPDYKASNVGWREIRALSVQVPGATVRETDRRVSYPGGGWIEIRSADDPQSLRSEGLDLVVIDEAAFVSEVAWNEALRPALADRRGKALFISTPKGRNWFWRAYQRGIDPLECEWQSWHAPTSANPFLPPGEIEAMRQGMPERTFRQEVMAEFLEDGAGVFRNVRASATAHPQDIPHPSHSYVFGVDWGKQDDWTVITVIDVFSREVVKLERFNRIDYAVQRGRLGALAERFHPTTIVAERNSIGEPIIEELERSGLPLSPFTTTNASKAQAIDALTLALERGELRLLDDPVLLAEMEAFESERLPSGMLRYAAPEGGHDDCVMSLALAWQAAAVPARNAYTVPLRRAGARF